MSRSWGRGQNFPKPENALKRAEELLRVGQKQAALQTLHNVFTGTGRRFRTWSTVYETIIARHLDLCCEMRKGRYAKEALQQYRNMCQSASISSLEEVIIHFMRRAQDKADEAQAASYAAELDMEDLDVNATPEDIMMSYVSGDRSKDRTDRTMVTPWFRFLWETYRNLLDILRHNSRLQALYSMSINRAFTFCVTYKRTSEFRRLCELLRSHLSNIQKRAFYGRDQKDRPELSNVETLQLYVDTRFEQLKAACELELWQEAFRSVEDIINLVVINPSIIQPSMMATYYSRLTQIFAFSDESSLYCAYAWHKLYKLAIKYNKKLTEIDIQMLSTSVLLAALGICPYNKENALQREVRSETVAERQRRMSNIMRFGLESKTETTEIYSREALLKELSSEAFLSNVPGQVQDLYRLMEHEFNPLGMCTTVEDLTKKLSEISCQTSSACPDISVDLTRYAPALKFVAVLKMLQQLSQVYSNIETSYLVELVPFMTFGELESIIVNSVKNRFINIRIDHRDGMFYFGEDNLDSENLVKGLSLFAERLNHVHGRMTPSADGQRMTAVLSEARHRMQDEHDMALARKQMIEQRKEEQEQFLLEKERAEDRKRKEQTQQAQAAEALRRQQEAERREQERLQREKEEREMEEAKAMLEKGNKKLKPGQKLDKQKIMQEVLTEQIKEQRELDRQLGKMTKRLDHLERAVRETEAPLIEKAAVKRIEAERLLYEEENEKNKLHHRRAWEIDVAEKHRLEKMLEEKEAFADSIRFRRQEEFEERRRLHEKEIAEQKEKRRIVRYQKRVVQFVKESKEMIIEAVKEEEAERQEAERMREEEKRRRVREEKEREFQKQAEENRKREADAEARKQRDREATLNKTAERDDKWVKRDAPEKEDRWSRKEPQPVRAAGGGGVYVPPRGIRTEAAETRGSPRGRWQTQRPSRTPPRSPTKTPPKERERSSGGRDSWVDRGAPRSPIGGAGSRTSTRTPPPKERERSSGGRDSWVDRGAPRSPIGGAPTRSGYVPPAARSGFQDSRPPPSSHPSSFYQGGGSGSQWRSSRESEDRGPSGKQEPDSRRPSSRGSSASNYVPPHQRKDRSSQSYGANRW